MPRATKPKKATAMFELTPAQRADFDRQTTEKRKPASIKLTPEQERIDRQILEEVEAEKEEVIAQGREAIAKARSDFAPIGSGLRRFRESAGLSLADVAEATGMTKQSILRVESGQNCNPKIDTLKRIADAVGAKVDIKLRPLR